MQLRIHANSVRLSSSLRERIAGQVAAVLAPFDPWIQSVEVSLADINGQRGGVDKECRIELRTARRAPLQVTDKASGIMAAVGLAARRAGFALRRQTQRWREKHGRAGLGRSSAERVFNGQAETRSD